MPISKRLRIGYILVIIFLFFRTGVYGQEPPDTLLVKAHPDSLLSIRQAPDSLSVVLSDIHLPGDIRLISDTSVIYQSSGLEFVTHSPAKATIMSAVLPGLGQIYNGKAWKVPVVYAALGTSVYILIKWQNTYQQFRRAYIDFYDGDPNTNYFNTLNLVTTNVGQAVSKGKDVYRRYRDWSVIAVIVFYGLNILDANVDAHFFNYDVSDNISMNLRPCILDSGMDSRKIGLNLRFSF